MNAVAAQIDSASRVGSVVEPAGDCRVPTTGRGTLASARDLLDPAIRRIAIGDPCRGSRRRLREAVPADARHLARSRVEGGSVRQRAARAACRRERRRRCRDRVSHRHRDRRACVGKRWSFRSAEGPRIVYPAAVVRAGKNQEGGRRLLAFLRSPEASAVFTRARISSRRSPRGTRPRVNAEIRDIAIFTTLAALAATARDAGARVSRSPGCWRARQFPGKSLVETVVSLPLVMPPVATGLLLLWLFSRRGPRWRTARACRHRDRVHPGRRR